MKTSVFRAILVTLVICIGFVQERAKVSLNYYLEQTAGVEGFYEWPPDRRDAWLRDNSVNAPYDYYYNHGRVGIYDHFSRKQLETLKWAYALAFIIVHYFLCVALVKAFLPGDHINKISFQKGGVRFFRIPIYKVYFVALMLSMFFFALYYLSVAPEASYAISRKILGFMQSPLPAVLLILASRLNTRLEPL